MCQWGSADALQTIKSYNETRLLQASKNGIFGRFRSPTDSKNVDFIDFWLPHQSLSFIENHKGKKRQLAMKIFHFINEIYISKFFKTFLSLLSFADFKDIESYCLAQWAALTNCNKIAQLDISVEKTIAF